MNNDSLWKLVCEAEEAVIVHYEPVFDRFCDSTGMDGPLLGLLLAALAFEPEVTSPSRLLVRTPYTAADTFMARLWVAAEKGFMLEAAPGEYRLTAIGRARLEDLIQEARLLMANVDPLTQEESQCLAGVFEQLVRASLDTQPPPEPWSIRLGHKLIPSLNPPLPYIEQAISCLHGYRDDAHLAAWQKTGLTATALEALTCLWQGAVDSLEGLCQLLARRGHSPQVYTRALEDLRQLGLMEGTHSALQLTSTGKSFREKVEKETDRLFYTPWGSLKDEQREDMASLLMRLRDLLNDKKT